MKSLQEETGPHGREPAIFSKWDEDTIWGLGSKKGLCLVAVDLSTWGTGNPPADTAGEGIFVTRSSPTKPIELPTPSSVSANQDHVA